jgi:hypothetical protein
MIVWNMYNDGDGNGVTKKESGTLKERTWLHTIDLNINIIFVTLQQIAFHDFFVIPMSKRAYVIFIDFNITTSCIY